MAGVETFLFDDATGAVSQKVGEATYHIGTDGKVRDLKGVEVTDKETINKAIKGFTDRFGKSIAIKPTDKGALVQEMDDFVKLRKVFEGVEIVHPKLVGDSAGIFTSASELEKIALEVQRSGKPATADQLREISRIMAKHPEAANVMSSASAYNHLHTGKVSVDGKEVAAINLGDAKKGADKFRAMQDNIKKGISKLEGLTGDNLNEANVRKILLEHKGLAEALPTDLVKSFEAESFGKPAINIEQIAKELTTEISEFNGRIGTSAKKISNLLDELKDLESAKGDKSKAILDLERKIGKELAKIDEIKAQPEYKGFAPHADDTLRATLGEEKYAGLKDHKLTKGTFSSFAKGAEEAGEKAKGGKWYSLMHGEEKLTEIAAKKSVNGAHVEVKDLKFFDKLNKGKTAAVAVGATVIGMVIAGMGNKPGEHAEAEMSRRSMGGAEPARG